MKEQGFEDIPFLSNIGLMLTYKCTIACPHCIVKAGPSRTEEIRLEDALKWIDELKLFKNGYVVGVSLTGGEPFYNIEKLAAISDYAVEKGFVVSVVTNAYWAGTRESALGTLCRCKSINALSISADVGHQQFIPLSNVRNAIWAAKKLDLIYDVVVTAVSEVDKEYLEIRDELLDFVDADKIHMTITLPVGRALETLGENSSIMSEEPSRASCSMASFPVIFPNGDVIACIGPPITLPIGHPLYLGNLNKIPLEEVFMRAEKNIILHAIRTYGPRILVALLSKGGYGRLLPNQYVQDATCDVCYKLLGNKEVVEALSMLIVEQDFVNTVAYGRNYYLGEQQMLEMIK